MREYKFRGKRKDNGVWVYGSLLQNEVWTVIIDEFVPYECEYCYGADGYDVIPETVGEYTGLCDKDGTRIYEGDILDGGYLNPLTGQKVKQHYLVEFEKGIFYAKLIGKSPYGDTFLYFQNARSAIIGNVHENKELLEVEKC